MKLIAYILSLYLLVLTASPCIDVPKDHALQKVEMSQHSQDSSHHNDANHCSPFCTCNCNTTSIFFQEYPVQHDCLSFSENQYAHILAGHFSSPAASIWQPPKIA